MDGLSKSGNRLRFSGTRKKTSQDVFWRKTSGNGRGHDERQIHRTVSEQPDLATKSASS